MELRILDGGHTYLEMWYADRKLHVRRMPRALDRHDVKHLREFLDQVAEQQAKENPDRDNVVDHPAAETRTEAG